MRRVHDRGTNMHRIVEVNEISRKYCAGELPAEETWKKLKSIKGRQYTVWMYNVATVLVPVGFAPLFGGGLREVLAAAAVGILLAVIMTIGKRLRISSFILNMICAGGVAAAAMLLKSVVSGPEYGYGHHQRYYAARAGSGDYQCNTGYAPRRLHFGGGAGAGSFRDSGGCGDRSRCRDCGGECILAGRWASMTELFLVTAGCFIAVMGFAVLVETPKKYILQGGSRRCRRGLGLLFQHTAGNRRGDVQFPVSPCYIPSGAYICKDLQSAGYSLSDRRILPTVPGAACTGLSTIS